MSGSGFMIPPPRHLPPPPQMISGAAGYVGSSSALSLAQPSFLDEHQLHLPHHHDHVHHHLLDIPDTMTAAVADGELLRDQLDEFDSKSGSENVDGGGISGSNAGDELGDAAGGSSRKRKKRYHRHTQHQIQEMEAFFKECPHPDDKQRKELSRELGLEPLQVKFWFQNKRTQMKNQHERHENALLRAENEKLRAENMRYKEALAGAACPNCGGGGCALGEMSFDEHHLRIENARLREEIDRVSAIAAKYVGKPAVAFPVLSSPAAASRAAAAAAALELGVGGFGMPPPPPEMFGGGGGGGGHSEMEKTMIVEMAVAAMEELVRMAQLGEPLWAAGPDGGGEVLNEEEYARIFRSGSSSEGLRPEATRERGVVIMNHVNLVDILMDANQYSTVFSSIVSRAVTLEVLSTGVAGNYDGALQVMSAEFQVPSPLVPTRESHFVRYCKQTADGAWAIVDVSMDSLRPSLMLKYRRRPSGCVIHQMPNGYSKITWVEHMEVDDVAVHSIYRALVHTGLAFGARRWVCTLDRQCERMASAMASSVGTGDIGVITSAEGRKSMLKLAERMVMSFCGGVTASTAHQWTTLSGSGAEDVRVMTRKSVDDPGRPPGIVLNAATSFWLPVAPKRVFDFLRDESTRNEWDMFSTGGVVQEMAHIANGRDHGNCVSLLRVNNSYSNQSNMLILQESCTDATGSYVIYAPVDVTAMNIVLNGGDPDYIALLPSGFAILPDGGGSTNGSLLTVAFQILVDSVPTAKLSLGSVATVNSLIACTVEWIKAAVGGAGGGDIPAATTQ